MHGDTLVRRGRRRRQSSSAAFRVAATRASSTAFVGLPIARVNVAEGLQTDTGRMITSSKHERCLLIDRRPRAPVVGSGWRPAWIASVAKPGCGRSWPDLVSPGGRSAESEAGLSSAFGRQDVQRRHPWRRTWTRGKLRSLGGSVVGLARASVVESAAGERDAVECHAWMPRPTGEPSWRSGCGWLTPIQAIPRGRAVLGSSAAVHHHCEVVRLVEPGRLVVAIPTGHPDHCGRGLSAKRFLARWRRVRALG